MSKVVVVVGHARRGTYGEALGEAYKRGAQAAGHDVALFVLSHMSFDPILHEGFSVEQPLEPDLAAARAAIGTADHLVLVFPLWFGDLPALLKGFIERLFQPGFAIERTKTLAGFRPLLTGKSARIIVTMGMPAFVYRWYFRAHAVRMLKRNILGFVGIHPVRTTLLGRVEAVSPDQRRRWLDDAEAFGRRAA